MQLLDWVVVVTVGAIVLVLLDGFRRKWRDRRNRVVMKLDRNLPQDPSEPDEFPYSELPNGGARTLLRDNEPPPGSPLQRKRNYQLKDGRDKVRNNEPEPTNVPVLMDPVEIEESDIEHANVFITAETSGGFANEELPPEVLSGLDDDMDADTLTDNAAALFVTVSGDPLMDGMPSGRNERYHDQFEPSAPAQPEDELTAPHAAADATGQSGMDSQAAEPEDAATTEATDAESDEEGYEDGHEEEADEEYDPTQDEHYYENEPALLENAYKLATSHFQRQPKEEPAPRIEPGFGEQQEEQEESAENFGAILDESVMTEFLEEEQEEIRAWRHQSATRQSEPAQSTAAPQESSKPAAQVTAVHIEPRVINVQPEPEPVMRAEPASTPKDAKSGFWQNVTGKSAKAPAKTEPPKIDQGELFREDEHHEEPVVETGPQEVIIVNVMAQSGMFFQGADLMPVLQHFGLRLGSMSIFHRHTEVDGSGPVMFSMANMVKPGTFSHNDMDHFATPGLSFFVQLPNRHGNMKAFELMLATANGVKQALDGVLKDERRSVLTRQTVEHCRQRVRDFELSLLSRK